MFRLNSIELQGIFSIDKFQFDFTQNTGKTLVVGRNNDEFSATRDILNDATATISNESGKTNFFDAIEEHFTGGTPKGLKNDGIVNVFTNTGALSRAEWSVGDHQYQTTKYRKYCGDDGTAKAHTGIEIIQDGVDLTKRRNPDNKQSIQTYFPYDLSEFRSLVYVPASEIYPLLLPDAKATAKRRLMNTIYRLHYEDLLKACRERKSQVERAIDQLKARMSGEIESLEEQLNAVGNLDSLRAELQALPESQVHALGEQIKVLDARVQEISSLQSSVTAMLDQKRALQIDDPEQEQTTLQGQLRTLQDQLDAGKVERQQLADLFRNLETRERYLQALHGYAVRENELYQILQIEKDVDIETFLATAREQHQQLTAALPRYAQRDMLRGQCDEIRSTETIGSAAALEQRLVTLDRDLETEDRCIDIYNRQKMFVLAHGIHFCVDFDEATSLQRINHLNEEIIEVRGDLADAKKQLARAEQGDCPECGKPYDDIPDVATIQSRIAEFEIALKDADALKQREQHAYQTQRDAMRAYQDLPADEHGNVYQLLESKNGSLITPYEELLAQLQGTNQKRRRIRDNLRYTLDKMRELERYETALKDYEDLDHRNSPQIQAEIHRLDKVVGTADELRRTLLDHHRDYAEWQRAHAACNESTETSLQVQERMTALDTTQDERQTSYNQTQDRYHTVSGFITQHASCLSMTMDEVPVDEIDTAMTQLAALREERDTLISKRSELQSQLDLAARLEASIAESRAKQAEVDALRRKQQIWHTLTYVFGAAGLPKDKIQEIVYQINDRIKVYAPIIFHRPRQIYFEVGDNGDILLRQTKGGHVMKSVTNSSGGRIKVTAAVLFALRDTLPPDKKSNSLILDEFDLNLDEISALRILDALDVHIQRSHVENVLMTSHKTLLRTYKSQQTGSNYWDRILLATMQNEITTYSVHAA